MKCALKPPDEISRPEIRVQDLREDVSHAVSVLCCFVEDGLDRLHVMQVGVPADRISDQIARERSCHRTTDGVQARGQLTLGFMIRLTSHAANGVIIVQGKRDWIEFLVATGAGFFPGVNFNTLFKSQRLGRCDKLIGVDVPRGLG